MSGQAPKQPNKIKPEVQSGRQSRTELRVEVSAAERDAIADVEALKWFLTKYRELKSQESRKFAA